MYEQTPELRNAVQMRGTHWERKFDPIQQAVEHKTLEVDILNDGNKVINVREPKEPILTDHDRCMTKRLQKHNRVFSQNRAICFAEICI